MSDLWLDTTLADLVTERPGRALVFDRFDLDFANDGARTLSAASAEPAPVVEALKQLDALPPAPDELAWTQLDMTGLADHIENVHHAYLRSALPRLDALTAQAQGQSPALAEVRGLFVMLRAELESHMMKEEQILFPICRQLEAADGPLEFHCGSVNNPIRVMEHEHASATAALARMRSLTAGFTPPADASAELVELLAELDRLEHDLHLHIHKENNVLFPRAAQAERAAAG